MRKLKPQKSNREGLGVNSVWGWRAVPLSPEDWGTAMQSSDCNQGAGGRHLDPEAACELRAGRRGLCHPALETGGLTWGRGVYFTLRDPVALPPRSTGRLT